MLDVLSELPRPLRTRVEQLCVDSGIDVAMDISRVDTVRFEDGGIAWRIRLDNMRPPLTKADVGAYGAGRLCFVHATTHGGLRHILKDRHFKCFSFSGVYGLATEQPESQYEVQRVVSKARAHGKNVSGIIVEVCSDKNCSTDIT